MIEFIPSPIERRGNLVRDYTPLLLEILHDRICRIEQTQGIPAHQAQQFAQLLSQLKADTTPDPRTAADSGERRMV
jgi:hypothetical protein